uniref:Phospholipid transfer protein n=1 Tax=Anser brachyrhynchus TaxID=132585 RepID=A0A8B9BWZ9_9AVES
MEALDPEQEGARPPLPCREPGKNAVGKPWTVPQSCRQLCLLLLDGEAPAPGPARHPRGRGRQHISVGGRPGSAPWLRGRPHGRAPFPAPCWAPRCRTTRRARASPCGSGSWAGWDAAGTAGAGWSAPWGCVSPWAHGVCRGLLCSTLGRGLLAHGHSGDGDLGGVGVSGRRVQQSPGVVLGSGLPPRRGQGGQRPHPSHPGGSVPPTGAPPGRPALPPRSASRCEMAAGSRLLLLLLLPCLATASLSPPGCRIRITSKGLDLVKQEGLRFVEQELENITVSDLHGKEGQFHYNISQVKVVDLQLPFSDLHFQPQQHLAFNINNASISLRFRRQLLYWFFYDIGSINASADGVHIHTVLQLAKDEVGRLKISNISCNASIARMHAGFSGTLRKVYEFLSTFIVTGMRFLVSQQICPSLEHASLVLLNSLLDTVPVRNYVDDHIGIDYSLLRDPSVSPDTLDLDFKGMFFYRARESQELENHAVEPVIKETERMVYVAFSEYFFDSAMHAYFQAGVLAIELEGEKVPKDLEVLLRATFFGTIFMLSPAVVDAPLRLVLQVSAPPRCVIKPSGTSVSVSAFLNISLVPAGRPPVQLSSMAMETKLSAKVFLQGKALRVQLDLRRFRIYSKQSALESLALFSLQAPLKTLLQLTIMPIINERTRKGVQIPLPEGMDFTREVVTNHAGFLTVGADLHFQKGLREVIEKYHAVPAAPTSPPAAPSADPRQL